MQRFNCTEMMSEHHGSVKSTATSRRVGAQLKQVEQQLVTLGFQLRDGTEANFVIGQIFAFMRRGIRGQNRRADTMVQ